ncbi:hypothetical protein PH213_42625 [Streptomyces sp. SRF1]|nr:hypothetical protein [Streptomyces sp. SRF1]MDN3061080.1 hypothetical protein [Streptomyces sp. SRF1]
MAATPSISTASSRSLPPGTAGPEVATAADDEPYRPGGDPI